MRAASSTPGYDLPMLQRIAPAALVLLAGCDLDTILDAFNEHAQATRAPHTAPAIPGIPGLPAPSVPTGRPPPPSAGAFVPSPQAALGAPVDQTQQDELLLVKPQYVLSYNRFRNAPNWAAWRLTAADLGDTGRTRSGFAPDPQLPDGVYRVLQGDYRGSGYDRGHLVPSAQRTADPEDNAATFLTTNILPQRHDLNAGAWESLESWSLDMARQGWELYTVAGGLYPPQCATDRTGAGNSPDPSCESIGRSDDVTRRVGVPTSTWKVIVMVPQGAGLRGVSAQTPALAVDMPNDGSAGHDWRRYVLSVDALEQRTGYDFFTAVPPAVQGAIEARVFQAP